MERNVLVSSQEIGRGSRYRTHSTIKPGRNEEGLESGMRAIG